MATAIPITMTAGAGEFVYTETQRIFYNTKQPVAIHAVILALQGLEGLLKPVPAILATLTGVEFAKTQFLIESLGSGSLWEDVAVRFYFHDKAGLDAFVDKIKAVPGVKPVVTAAVVAALVGLGLQWASGGKPAPAIQATNSVIMINGAGTFNVSPEVFKSAVESAAKGNQKSIAENALKATVPVRSDAKSSVTFGAATQDAADLLTIPHNAVAEAPPRIEFEPNERVEKYTNTALEIRATDRDSKKRGWAGRLGTREERLPIEIDPAVSAADMFGRETVKVDADLIFREKGKSGELKPVRIYVRKVHSPA